MDDPLRGLEELLNRLDEPGYDPWPAAKALADSGDAALVPRASAAMDRFVDREDSLGADVMADVLTGLQGVDALPTLLRASARIPRSGAVLRGTIHQLVARNPEAGLPTMLAFARDPGPGARRA